MKKTTTNNNATNNNSFEMTKKIFATKEQLLDFARYMTEHNTNDYSFNIATVLTREDKPLNVAVTTHIVTQSGDTNKGTLISVWNTNKKSRTCYSVRISEELQKKLVAKNKALKTLFSNFKHADSYETRCDFYSIDDVRLFFDKMFSYTEKAKSVKKIESVESVSA